MSDATTNLLLPYLLAAQAQKHVTHNEALRLLDGLVHLCVRGTARTAPPPDPNDGDRFLVASGATGDWSGWDNSIAYWVDGAWLQLPPRPGWRAWVEEFDGSANSPGESLPGERLLLVYDGSDWVGTTPSALQNMALLGLGTTADAANPFSAKLNTALWAARTTAEGGNGDLRYVLNKESTSDVLSFLLQSGFSARAELGLVGSDDLTLKVSPDGSTWHDALTVDRSTGIIDQPALPRFKGYANFDTYVGLTTWTKIAINAVEANDQGCFDTATSLFTAPADGTYLFGASLQFKTNGSNSARMSGRLVLNGTTEIRGSYGELSGSHRSLSTTLWLQTVVPLSAGDTVELQGYFRVADGYFAADATTFWGAKIG